jgi:signal transduction histidine kinase
VTLKEHGTSLVGRTRDEIIGHLVEQAEKLDRLLSDLLDLDRLRHGSAGPKFRATDVAALVHQVADGYGQDGRVEIDAEPVVAEVDAARLERIVENLLANAIKHTPPGTDVRVRVAANGDTFLLTVDDRGDGIPEHDRESVFELFNRGEAHESLPGAGIGLALVAQFAAVHHGRAWVEDSPGGGASFRVELPVRQP